MEKLKKHYLKKEDIVDEFKYNSIKEMVNLKFQDVKKRKETIVNINSNDKKLKLIMGVFYPCVSTDYPRKNREVLEDSRSQFDNIPIICDDITKLLKNEFGFTLKEKLEDHLNTKNGTFFYRVFNFTSN